MEFTTGDLLSALSVACTMLTAICSLLLSYLTARMNLRASDQLRRTELIGPKLCEAVSRLCVAFGQLQRDDTRSYALEKPEPSMMMWRPIGLFSVRAMRSWPSSRTNRSIGM